MVLQQAPAKAAVSGFLNASGSVAPVSVQVSPAGYTVQATVTKLAEGKGYSWKAFLRPAKDNLSSAQHTISIRCEGTLARP